jgi:hypothetical protein
MEKPMPTIKKSFLAGTAALALAGSCGLALAGAPERHEMTVRLPDGGTARIEYTGNVPPKVTFARNPFAVSFFGAGSPFAELDRISAQMDREMAAMMSEGAGMPMPSADPNPLFEANLSQAGSGSGFCMKSVEITQSGSEKPKVVQHSAGNCSPAQATGLAAEPHAASRPMPIGTWMLTQPGPAMHEAAYQPRD